jgi:hypothetical protein
MYPALLTALDCTAGALSGSNSKSVSFQKHKILFHAPQLSRCVLRSFELLDESSQDGLGVAPPPQSDEIGVSSRSGDVTIYATANFQVVPE